MKKLLILAVCIGSLLFAPIVFAKGGGSVSSGGARSSFSSSSVSRSSPSSIRPSQAAPIRPSQAAPIKPSGTTWWGGNKSAPASTSPSTARTTTYVYHNYNYAQPAVNTVYVREPSSGFGSFWMNMWIYQSLFERRPHWDDSRGPRPTVTASSDDGSAKDSYSEYAKPMKKKWDFVDYAVVVALLGAIGLIIWGIVEYIKKKRGEE